MNLLSDPIWIPLSHRFLNGVAIGSVVLALLIVVFAVQWRKGVASRLLRLREKLGLTELNPWLVGGLGLVWALLFAVFLLAMFWVVIGILGRVGAATPEEGTDLRWSLLTLTAMTASLGAVISLPFTLIRVTLNRRQTETAEQGMITDRINKAVQGLGADKSVREIIETPRYRTDDNGEWFYDNDGKLIPASRPDGTPMVDREEVERTEPNLEVRIGAIYALERIAQDSDRDHVQIMEILCAYIRENAPAGEARPWPELEMYERESEGPLEEDWEKRKLKFKKQQDHMLDGLTCRTDIQAALTVIGRRTMDQRQLEARRNPNDESAVFVFDLPYPDADGILSEVEANDPKPFALFQRKKAAWDSKAHAYDAYRLDLRHTNLRGADLKDLNFAGAQFQKAQMQGANLSATRMQGAELTEAQMQGAFLGETQMQGTKLWKAQMQGAKLRGVRMQGARLSSARLQGAVLNYARMQGTVLSEALMQGAILCEARMDGATLVAAQMQGADLSEGRMQGALLWGAQLQGAILREAQMQGVYLRRTWIDGNTNLDGTNLQGAAARSVDFTNIQQIRPHLSDLFGDASVTLPDGQNRPARWPNFRLVEVLVEDEEVDRYIQEWRKWQKDPEGYTPPEE